MTASIDLVPTGSHRGSSGAPSDHRGSPIPTGSMVAARFMELRKRRGLMITLIVVTIGLPTIFLAIRLVAHAVAPKTYGPAGGYSVYVALSAGVLYTFGFIVAATLGCSAGSLDLSEGVFRHLVITGRSRVALYLARIPAGLAIIMPLVAIGFTIVCAVSVFAAPATLNYSDVQVPAGLSQSALETWASDHANDVICGFPHRGSVTPGSSDFVDCVPGPTGPAVKVLHFTSGGPATKGPGVVGPTGNLTVVGDPTHAQAQAAAIHIAKDAYADYRTQFTRPSMSLMLKTGLWLELEAAIGLIVGLGLGSLLGQRTVAVILMIVLELVLTPILIRAQIPHMINLQRGVVGVAMGHLEPGHLPLAMGGGGLDYQVKETTTTAVLVILGWLVGWTGLGAWRMAKRDA